MEEHFSVAEIRELGKDYFLNNGGDIERRNEGVRLLLRAKSLGDPEAAYCVAKLILDGALMVPEENQEEHALELMYMSANAGCIQARAFLNAYCEERYEEQVDSKYSEDEECGALVDFDGKPIKINKQGIFTPIDAVLEYKNGSNVLTLSVNVEILLAENINNYGRLMEAIYSGILAWQGEYEVFGGQRLTVKINLTSEDRALDNLFIIPVTDELSETMRSVSNLVGTKAKKGQMESIITSKRSFAISGLRWSVNSRKVIYLQSHSGRFDDYDEIKHVIKHEFGHALGLGDLYESAVDSLGGVEKGTYIELDSYIVTDKIYNLVMCDHHGPISNNDIEMVVLAYRENKMQHYQSSRLKGKISSALGKGN